MTQNFNQEKKKNSNHKPLAGLQIGLLLIIIAGFVFTPTIYSHSWSDIRLMTTFGDDLDTIAPNRIIDRTDLAHAKEISRSEQVEVTFTTSYSLIWNELGGKASFPVSFWRPNITPGWSRVGDHISTGHTIPTNATMIVRPITSGAIANPIDYDLIWDDSGSGATMDGSVWRPVCPTDYEALGDVTNSSYARPATTEMVCVHRSALVIAGPGNLIWNNVGSTAHALFGSWNIVPLMGGLSSGLFFGADSHSRPAITLWAVRPTFSPTPTPAGPAPGEQALWDTAKRINTKDAYEKYLLSYPQGIYVKSANLALSALTGLSPTPTPTPGGDPNEALFWAEVEKANTRDSYEKYLNNFPFGPHANQARIRIGFSGGASASPTPNQANDSAKKEKEQALWETVRALNTVDGYQDFIKNYPDGVYAESARILMKSAPSAKPTPAPVATPTPSPRVSADDEFWNKIKNSNRVADFEVYLQAFPSGDHRADAMLTISRLKPAKQEPPAEKLRECTVNGVVNLRDDSNNGKKIGTLSKGETVIFMEKDGSWTRVGENRRGRVVPLGWVFGTYLDCDP